MNDEQIITLYQSRDEQAIQETMNRYESYCRTVAGRILENSADVDEALADTWLQAWCSIPPQHPKHLHLFLAKITRNISLSIWRRNHAHRRGSGQTALALEELGECVANTDSPEMRITMRELEASISVFLKQQPQRHRSIFLRRYFYLEETSEIARQFGLREANVRMILSRTRQKLKQHLIQEGYIL